MDPSSRARAGLGRGSCSTASTPAHRRAPSGSSPPSISRAGAWDPTPSRPATSSRRSVASSVVPRCRGEPGCTRRAHDSLTDEDREVVTQDLAVAAMATLWAWGVWQVAGRVAAHAAELERAHALDGGAAAGPGACVCSPAPAARGAARPRRGPVADAIGGARPPAAARRGLLFGRRSRPSCCASLRSSVPTRRRAPPAPRGLAERLEAYDGCASRPPSRDADRRRLAPVLCVGLLYGDPGCSAS